MRLLVTGGAGFIGSHVAEAARREGWQVGVLDNLSRGRLAHISKGTRFFRADVRDASALEAVIAGFRPEVICHHAAQSSIARSLLEPIHDASVNILGGLKLLEAARQGGVKRLVYASSGGAIYGETASGAARRLPNPTSPYAASKLAFEHYLKVYAAQFGLDYAILRYANVYGPRQDPDGEAGVVAIFLERMLKHLPVQINAMKVQGDGGCVRDYVYVEDVVRANLLAVRGGLSRRTLDVATGVGTTTLGLAMRLREISQSRSPFRFAPLRPGDIERSVLDASEFAALLGAPTALDRGLMCTYRWFLRREAASLAGHGLRRPVTH